MLAMPDLNRRTITAAMITTAMKLQAASSKIDTTLRTGIVTRKIPAAVGMVASGNKILYQGAFGTRDASGVPA